MKESALFPRTAEQTRTKHDARQTESGVSFRPPSLYGRLSLGERSSESLLHPLHVRPIRVPESDCCFVDDRLMQITDHGGREGGGRHKGEGEKGQVQIVAFLSLSLSLRRQGKIPK